MKFEKTVHIALDELRMQMLGTQVLFGFQLQGAFQERFDLLGPAVKIVALLALALMVLTLGFLLAAPCQHRLVERGTATVRIFKVANRFAELALAPFAVAIGCDLYVVATPYWSHGALLLAGAAFFVAIMLWYGAGLVLRAFVPLKEQEKPLPSDKSTDLHERIDQMLTEARVILPGAQALLGFQLVVTMTKAFASLPETDRQVHFAALACIATSMMLLLTPAAVHRLTFGGRDVPRFHDIGSWLVTVALAPLGLGITADVYVATIKMLGNDDLALTAAVSTFIFLATFWYAVPFWLRGAAGRRLA